MTGRGCWRVTGEAVTIEWCVVHSRLVFCVWGRGHPCLLRACSTSLKRSACHVFSTSTRPTMQPCALAMLDGSWKSVEICTCSQTTRNKALSESQEKRRASHRSTERVTEAQSDSRKHRATHRSTGAGCSRRRGDRRRNSQARETEGQEAHG
eukprot:6213234-Pleurochrysis_carterae.AAC.1